MAVLIEFVERYRCTIAWSVHDLPAIEILDPTITVQNVVRILGSKSNLKHEK